MNDSPGSANFSARQLRLWLATLSPGDLSVNEGAAARPGSTVVTGAGSANDDLWSQMAHAGWTERITDEPLSIPGVTSAYVLTAAGARAMTTELAAIAAVTSEMVGRIEGYDPHTAPERLRRLCDKMGALFLRTTSQATLVKEAKPASEDARARQRDCLLALDEILKGVSTAGIFITDAIAHGPDSSVGQDLLERTARGLRYAEQCLSDWAGKIRAEQFGNLAS